MDLPLLRRLKPTTRAAVTNGLWLLSDQGLRMIVALVIGWWLARYLGPSQFGTLSYALAVVAMGMVAADAGLEAVVKRRLIAQPDRAGAIIADAIALRLGGAALGYGVLFCFPMPDRSLLWILGLMLLQPMIAVPELWLQARLAGRDTTLPRWTATLGAAIAKVGCIVFEAPLEAIAWVLVAESLGTAGLTAMRARGRGLVWLGVQ